MNGVYDFIDAHPSLVFWIGSLTAVVNFALGLAAGWHLARR